MPARRATNISRRQHAKNSAITHVWFRRREITKRRSGESPSNKVVQDGLASAAAVGRRCAESNLREGTLQPTCLGPAGCARHVREAFTNPGGAVPLLEFFPSA